MNVNLILPMFLYFLVSSTFAEELKVISHGDEFERWSNMNYQDYDKLCHGYGLYYGNVKYNYIFQYKVLNLGVVDDRDLIKEYEDSLLAISAMHSMDNTVMCSENNLFVFQSALKEVRALDELFITKYNVSAIRRSRDGIQKRKIKSIQDSLDIQYKYAQDSIKKCRRVEIDSIRNDSELSLCINSKSYTLDSISKYFGLKLERIVGERDSLLEKLKQNHYTENRKKILDMYNPQISEFQKVEATSLNDAEQFWNDRISRREEIVQSKINNLEPVENLETSIKIEFENRKDSIRKTISNETNTANECNQRLNDAMVKYQSSIKTISDQLSIKVPIIIRNKRSR